MKNDSDLNEFSSRRTFTKSIAAAIISAPIVASAISCRSSTSTNETAQTTPSPTPSPTTGNVALISVDECKPPDPSSSEDHIPPFLLGEGGSFSIESTHQLTDPPEPISPPIGTRKWRYKLTGTTQKYGNIQSVQPLIESKWYLDSRFSYVLADKPNGLKLWFQHWDNTTQTWKLPPPSQASEPDVLVKGKSGGAGYDSFILEVDDKFAKNLPGRKNKKSRPHKRVREFGPNDDEVRIYRWAIVDENNQVIKAGTLDDETPPYEGFEFMVTFHH
jgi:hypothetical protein